MKFKKQATEDDLLAICMFNLGFFIALAISSGILFPTSSLNLCIVTADLAVSLGFLTCISMKPVFLEVPK